MNEVLIAPSPTPKSVDSNPKNTSTNSITQEEAVNLIDNWLQAKRRIFGSSHETHLAEQFLTGKAYNDIIYNSNGKESFSQQLIRRGGYYEFGVQNIDEIKTFIPRENSAIIEVVTTEQGTYYNEDGTINAKETAFKTKVVKYILQKDDRNWKISDLKTIEVLQER